jgi:hypothetical protein
MPHGQIPMPDENGNRLSRERCDASKTMGSGPFDVMRNGMRNIMRDVMRCMKCAVQNPVRSRNEVHFMNLIQPNRLKGRQ